MTDTSKSYAEALFSLAQESNTLEETLAALKMLRDGILDTPGAMELFASPSIAKDERCEVLDKAFGDVQPEHVMGLVHVLIRHGHIRALDDCLKAYAQLYDSARKLSTAYVTSAVELPQTVRDELVEKLSRKLGRTIRIECAVDPTLLGGMVVRVDGKIIDGSMRKRLHEIKEVMNR